MRLRARSAEDMSAMEVSLIDLLIVWLVYAKTVIFIIHQYRQIQYKLLQIIGEAHNKPFIINCDFQGYTSHQGR